MSGSSRATLILTLACTVLSTGTLQALADAASWQAVKVSGQAWVTTGGTKRDLVTGTTLDPDVTVVTAERSRVMLVRGTETIMIGPISVMAIAEHPDQQLSTTVLQKGGTATFDVERRNVQHFSVETPMLAAVVKGTHFTVVVGRTDGTVSVDRGNVDVTALATGQIGSISVGQRAKVDQRGLSVSGPGRRAAVTQVAPRQAVVASISEVTPTTTVSVGEMAAARSLSSVAAGTPAKTGLFSAIASAFSHTGQQGASAGGLFGTAASDRSAHTSAAAGPAGATATAVGSVPSAASVAGQPASAAAASAVGAVASSTANAGLSSVAASAGPAAAASPSAAASPPSAGIAASGSGASATAAVSSSSGASASNPSTAGSSAASSGTNTSSSASTSSSTGAAASNAAGSASSSASSGSNAGTSANASSPASSSHGKSDNGKGNAGTPGNGGANHGSSAHGSGKGNS